MRFGGSGVFQNRAGVAAIPGGLPSEGDRRVPERVHAVSCRRRSWGIAPRLVPLLLQHHVFLSAPSPNHRRARRVHSGDSPSFPALARVGMFNQRRDGKEGLRRNE